MILIDTHIWIWWASNFEQLNMRSQQVLARHGQVPLSPEILVASTQLPEAFHHDPADQIIVATANYYQIPLLTEDERILAFKHVPLA